MKMEIKMKPQNSLGKPVYWLLFFLLVTACSALTLEPTPQMSTATAVPATATFNTTQCNPYSHNRTNGNPDTHPIFNTNSTASESNCH